MDDNKSVARDDKEEAKAKVQAGEDHKVGKESQNVSNLLKGIVVMVDEQVNSEFKIGSDPAPKILEAIKSNNYPVLTFEEIPDKGLIENLQNIAFLVLDWNLANIEIEDQDVASRVSIPDTIKVEMEQENIEFIKNFQRNSFCPIIIFSTESVKYIKRTLENGGVYDRQSQSNNILIANKSTVYDQETDSENLKSILAEWLNNTPSAYVIKKYEDALKKGMTDLSWSFYEKFPEWPIVFWNSYTADSIDNSSALLELMNNSLVSRITQTNFDKNILDKELDLTKIKSQVRALMETERIYSKQFSKGDSIITGDLFKTDKSFKLIITPLCDCIPRNGACNTDLSFLCLIGSEKKNGFKYNVTYGRIPENETNTILFPINNVGINFKFKEFQVTSYSDLSKMEYIGRVNAPFITYIQQKYGSYIQRQGLPRIPVEAIN